MMAAARSPAAPAAARTPATLPLTREANGRQGFGVALGRRALRVREEGGCHPQAQRRPSRTFLIGPRMKAKFLNDSDGIRLFAVSTSTLAKKPSAPSRAFATREQVSAASITAIGAFERERRSDEFDFASKAYRHVRVDEQCGRCGARRFAPGRNGAVTYTCIRCWVSLTAPPAACLISWKDLSGRRSK